ncbi:MAG: hypothetical protein ABEJ69_03005 [Candidatus Nanohaloarchaea archaeon]
MTEFTYEEKGDGFRILEENTELPVAEASREDGVLRLGFPAWNSHEELREAVLEDPETPGELDETGDGFRQVSGGDGYAVSYFEEWPGDYSVEGTYTVEIKGDLGVRQESVADYIERFHKDLDVSRAAGKLVRQALEPVELPQEKTTE